MLRLLCLLAFLAATVNSGVAGVCVAPFKLVGEGCYYFSSEDYITMTWEEARQHCISMGSEVDLAMLDYVCDDFRNLGTYLRLQGSVFYTWIGATGSDNNWFWLDGRTFSTDSSYWYHGFPSSSSGSITMALYNDTTNARIYLRELPASYTQPFFCQDYSATL